MTFDAGGGAFSGQQEIFSKAFGLQELVFLPYTRPAGLACNPSYQGWIWDFLKGRGSASFVGGSGGMLPQKILLI